jgi:competence protein ComEC
MSARASIDRSLGIVLAFLVACGGHKGPKGPVRPDRPDRPVITGAISFKKVETEADLPPPPGPGEYQIHMIDVGTGLSILVRGANFSLLYDAGTNDRDEKPMRVAAYLAATLGPSGDSLCVPKSAKQPTQRHKIDHVVLSHPHLDHASALDLVVHCYDVTDFWDSGRINDTKFYAELLSGISNSQSTHYHTALSVPEDHEQRMKRATVQLPRWTRFSEGDEVKLGAGAKFKILHAEGKTLPDPNQNSVVIAVTLGGTRLLLVGDAESGERRDPSDPIGDVEQHLVQNYAADIRADILQVGHHGSKTSSRMAFLEAVRPSIALVSSGPKQYGRTVLPDQVVIDALNKVGAKVLRTDERDSDCPVEGRIGGDHGPGGCDSYVILIGGSAK